MAFKPRGSGKSASDLMALLVNSKIQTENNALYQTIYGLISQLQQLQKTGSEGEEDTTPAVDGVSININPNGELFGVVRLASLTLTDAQIKALPTTPVTIVPAPGIGFIVKPFAFTIITNTSAGAYTNIDATYADFHLDRAGNYASYGPVDDAAAVPVMQRFSQIFGAAGAAVYDGLVPTVSATPNVAALEYVQPDSLPGVVVIENVPLDLKIENNGTGNLTGGNAANWIKFDVFYTIESVLP